MATPFLLYYRLRQNETGKPLNSRIAAEKVSMEIEHCYFPENLLYDSENHTWARVSKSEVTVGITSLLASLAGRMLSCRPKTIGYAVNRSLSLATLESQRFVGPAPSPLSGVLLEVNQRIVQNPKLLNDS